MTVTVPSALRIFLGGCAVVFGFGLFARCLPGGGGVDAWAERPHGGGSLTHGLLDVVLQSAGHSFLDVLLDCGGNLFVCDHLRNADSLD